MKSFLSCSTACIVALALPLIGCSNQGDDDGMPALFDTKAEAKKAAKDFGCSGAHKMGDKWMPCKKHGHNHDH